MPHVALNASFAEEIKESFARQLVMRLIGANLGRIEPGFVEINLPYRTDLTQQHRYLHAGIVAMIADSASDQSEELIATMQATMIALNL